MVNMQGTGQGSFLPGLGLQTPPFRVLKPARRSFLSWQTHIQIFKNFTVGFWEVGVCALVEGLTKYTHTILRSKLGSSYEEGHFPFLSVLAVKSLPKHPLLKQSLVPLSTSQIAPSPTWATLVKNDCRKAAVSAGFITSTHEGQIHLIFNISYMLKPALLQQYKKGNWLTSQLALKTRSQAALSALHDSFPLLQSKTSHPVCRWEEFTWVEFWLFLLRTGCALCRFLFNCRRKSFLP